jgi:ribosome-binding factor A
MTLRIQRVRELIRRELGTILEKDYTFNGKLVTINDVVVTQDLKQCFIYLGVLGTKAGGSDEEVIKKLEANRPQIQRALYKRVILRNSPQLIFRLDHSVERGVRVLHLIETLPPPAPDEAPEEEPKSEEGQG